LSRYRGTSDALLSGNVDLAISPQLPPVFGNVLMRIRLLADSSCDHPLHHQGRELSYRTYGPIACCDRDSGTKRDQRAATVEVDQRWTVSQVATSIQAVCMGYGFAWLPEEHISKELQTGILKPLPLKEGYTREVPLYLILAILTLPGPG